MIPGIIKGTRYIWAVKFSGGFSTSEPQFALEKNKEKNLKQFQFSPVEVHYFLQVKVHVQNQIKMSRVAHYNFCSPSQNWELLKIFQNHFLKLWLLTAHVIRIHYFTDLPVSGVPWYFMLQQASNFLSSICTFTFFFFFFFYAVRISQTDIL